MLDEGVRAALQYLGFDMQTVAYVERDASAASVLVARMEDQALCPAPVWAGDLGEFDGQPFRGMVDVLCAGLPCQPFSIAGARSGNDDPRAWGSGEGPQPNFLRLVAEIEPALVFLENVPIWVTGGHFRRFGIKLSGMGYTIEEPLFIRASDVGASHRRERVFVMAHRDGGLSTKSNDKICTGRDFTGDGNGTMADTNRPEREGVESGVSDPSGRQEPNGPVALPGGTGHVGNAEFSRTDGAGRGPRNSVGQPSGVFAPGPGDPCWPGIIERYPWLAPAVEPGFCVLVDELALVVDAGRADQLRQTGNGVFPLQGAVAFMELVRRAE